MVESGDPGKRSSKAPSQAAVQGRGLAIDRWSAIVTANEEELTTGNKSIWRH